MCNAMSNRKSVKERISEACEIQTNLRTLGALRSDVNRRIVADASNAFVKEGTSKKLRLQVDAGVFVEVIYTSKQDAKSGLTLTK